MVCVLVWPMGAGLLVLARHSAQTSAVPHQACNCLGHASHLLMVKWGCARHTQPPHTPVPLNSATPLNSAQQVHVPTPFPSWRLPPLCFVAPDAQVLSLASTTCDDDEWVKRWSV